MSAAVFLLTSFWISLPNTVLQEPDDKPTKTVTLVIQFSKNKQKEIKDIPFGKKLTVLDVLKIAQKQKKIRFEHRGKGETAFLTSIDGVKNKGARGDNWIFRVNGKLGKTSFGIAKLKAGDKITWTFGKYKP